MTTITGLDGLRDAMGTELGVTDWHEVTQDEVDAFADATGDHQWIHVDPERARQSPLGGTIAHGLFTLSLAPAMTSKLLSFEGFAFALNYGYNRVRFPAPLPVGSRVRLRARLANVEDIPGGAQITIVQTFEREGEEKPVCVAESLARVYVGE
jgi:acyl dehydratase